MSGGRLVLALTNMCAPGPDFRTCETATPPSPPLGVHRLRDQTHAERRTDAIDRVKARSAVGTQSLVECLTSNPSRFGDLRHSARARNIAQRRRQQRAILRLQYVGQVRGDGRLTVVVRGRVELRKIAGCPILESLFDSRVGNENLSPPFCR